MKKKLTAAIAIAVLFCVLLAVYLFVVVPMMNAEDEPEETTAVSLVPGEVEGVRGRIQMFDQVTSDKVQYAVTVVNIPAAAADKTIRVRPYVAYYDENNTVQYVYGAMLTRSVNEVLAAV